MTSTKVWEQMNVKERYVNKSTLYTLDKDTCPKNVWLSFMMSNCVFVTFPCGSGVELDCIDSWSLPSFLLLRKGQGIFQDKELRNTIIS